MEQQTNAYRKLASLHRQNSEEIFYAETAFPHCKEEWTKRGVTNVRMKVHCLEREIEGFRDFIYLRNKHGESRIDPIANQALGTFGSWSMVAYAIKRDLE
jgi:hypothetical protein